MRIGKVIILLILIVIFAQPGSAGNRKLFITVEFSQGAVDGRGIFEGLARIYEADLILPVHENFDVEGTTDGYNLGYGWKNRRIGGLKFQIGYRLSKHFALATSYCDNFSKYGEVESDFWLIKYKYKENSFIFSGLFYPIGPVFVEAGIENIFIQTTASYYLDPAHYYSKFDSYDYNYGPLLGVGIEQKMMKNINLTAEFSYSFADCDILEASFFMIKRGAGYIFTGPMKLNVHGPRFSAGLRYNI